MDGGALASIAVILGINSCLHISALLKVYKISGSLDQYMKGTDSTLDDHKDRISRLEGEHMGGGG